MDLRASVYRNAWATSCIVLVAMSAALASTDHMVSCSKRRALEILTWLCLRLRGVSVLDPIVLQAAMHVVRRWSRGAGAGPPDAIDERRRVPL